MHNFDNLLITLTVLIGVLFFVPISPAQTVHYSESSKEQSEKSNSQAIAQSETPDHRYTVKIQKYRGFSGYSDQKALKCLSVIEATLNSLPVNHVQQIEEITLSFDPFMRRGLGGGGKITIRCADMSQSELAAVLVHEVGHVVDTKGLNGTYDSGFSPFYDGDLPIYRNDPSVQFYGVNWTNSDSSQNSAPDQDFCSTYGKSDHFEDFGECYALFVLHGKAFRTMTKDNEKLRQKYDFLRKIVFSDKQYGLTEYYEPTKDRDYDVTVLPYSFPEFLMIGVKEDSPFLKNHKTTQK